MLQTLLLLLLKVNKGFNEVGVGAPLQSNISRDNVSINPVGNLTLYHPAWLIAIHAGT